MTASSADPVALRAYQHRIGEVDADIGTAGRRVTAAVDAFLASGPELGGGVPPLGAAVTRHARVSEEVAHWVGQVAAAFLFADGGGFFCRVGQGVVTADDSLLAPWIDYPTSAEARAAGERFAGEVAAGIERGEVSLETLQRWSATMRGHGDDPAYSAGFFGRLGVERTLSIPVLVERAYPAKEYGRPQLGLSILAPFSEALATAVATPQLKGRFAHDLAEYSNPYDYDRPGEHHLGLLLGAGGRFPTEFLVDAANAQVWPHLWRQTRGGPFGITPWGPGADTVANVLTALGRNRQASLQFLRGRNDYLHTTAMRLMLERWPELDGDAGRAAATVIDNGLSEGDAQLFREAAHVVGELGEVRNALLYPVLATAAVRRMDVLAAATREHADRGDLLSAHDFLKALVADDAAAATVDAGVLRYAAEVMARPTGRNLGWEATEVGGLMGLFAGVNNHFTSEEAEARVAERDALINGLQQVVDVGLTFSKAKVVPYVGMAADKIFEMAHSTHELDEALEDNAVFRDRLRSGVTDVIARRAFAAGQIAAPPHALFLDDRGRIRPVTEMTSAQRAAFGEWLDSPAVRDAITADRTMAGQRFDEVFDSVKDHG